MRIGVLWRASALGIAVMGVAEATPAQAGCVAADVIVHRTNEPDHPVVTDGQCLVPTPFGGVIRQELDVSWGSTATGVPSGVYLDVWVPW